MPPPSRGKGQLSFPPLVKKWTVKGEPNWPGAEYTRRTRLKTHCESDLSAEFVDELKQLMGENYAHFEEAMQPKINRKLTRGCPPSETGHKPIQPAYVLPRAKPSDDAKPGEDLAETLKGTTLSLSGHFSKTKHADTMHSPWGYVPEYMFEDREQMASLAEWFDKYGRPADRNISTSRPPYTTFAPLNKRCCGEPSAMTKTRKGFITQ